MALAIVALSLSTFASAATLECRTPTSGGFSAEISSTKFVSAQLSRDTYNGTYTLAELPDGTRLTGSLELDFKLGETIGCWPGSVFAAHLILRGPDFTTGFGSFEMWDAGGKTLSAGEVDCQVTGAILGAKPQ